MMTKKSSSIRAIVAEDFDAMKAVGGPRGIVEAILPTLIFLVIFATTQNIGLSAGISLASAGLAIAARLIARIDPSPALGGLGAVVISAYLSWHSGEAADFFVWGLIVNVAYLVVLVMSIVVRWPLIGVLIAMMRGESHVWRKHKVVARRYYSVTWMWVALFAFRAVVQLPLYFAGAITALGIAKLVMGIPLFALVVWLSWLMIRPLPSLAPTSNPSADQQDLEDRRDLEEQPEQ